MIQFWPDQLDIAGCQAYCGAFAQDRAVQAITINKHLRGRVINMPPFISIVGKSGSGKTMLIEKLIPILKARGYRVGTVKHAHHGFEIDQKGKDSARHSAAGADTVIVTSPHSLAMIKTNGEPSLNELATYMSDLDIVITEGYKHGDKPKIEVCRAASGKKPLNPDPVSLIAFVTDTEYTRSVPTFGLEEIDRLADLIEKHFLPTQGVKTDDPH